MTWWPQVSQRSRTAWRKRPRPWFSIFSSLRTSLLNPFNLTLKKSPVHGLTNNFLGWANAKQLSTFFEISLHTCEQSVMSGRSGATNQCCCLSWKSTSWLRSVLLLVLVPVYCIHLLKCDSLDVVDLSVFSPQTRERSSLIRGGF